MEDGSNKIAASIAELAIAITRVVMGTSYEAKFMGCDVLSIRGPAMRWAPVGLLGL
jgi:hypothetical protein